MNKFLFVVGPTCSGKNDYAYELSKLIDIEIINADSIQVYKQLKILSNRPTEKELKIVPHHLYGHINNKEIHNKITKRKNFKLETANSPWVTKGKAIQSIHKQFSFLFWCNIQTFITVFPIWTIP